MSRGYAPFIFDKKITLCYSVCMIERMIGFIYFFFSTLGIFIHYPTIITYLDMLVKSFGGKYKFYIF